MFICIIHPFQCKLSNLFRQKMSIIRDRDTFRYFRFGFLCRMKNRIFPFNKRPFKGLFRSVNIKAFSILT